MAGHAPPTPEVEQPWFAPLIGVAFAIVVLASLGLATAAIYDSSDSDTTDHSDSVTTDHDDTTDSGHSDDEG
jgi:hypothetical protein